MVHTDQNPDGRAAAETRPPLLHMHNMIARKALEMGGRYQMQNPWSEAEWRGVEERAAAFIRSGSVKVYEPLYTTKKPIPYTAADAEVAVRALAWN